MNGESAVNNINLNNLVRLKVDQAIEIMNEVGLDAWLIPTQEMGEGGDPMYVMVYGNQDLGRGYLLLTRTGRKIAIVGELDKTLPTSGTVWDEVVIHTGDSGLVLRDTLGEIDPETIGINYSTRFAIADGLSYGGYLRLQEALAGSKYNDCLVSAEALILRLRGRKLPQEVARIREAILLTDTIFAALHATLKPGLSGEEIYQFILGEVKSRNLQTAWSADHCPVVTVGPMPSLGHTAPTRKTIQPGQLLQVDFGVRHRDYCSDFQRVFYFLEDGESGPPDEVLSLFNTICRAIDVMKENCLAGNPTWLPPKEARNVMDDAGYHQYVYPGGHHLGRMTHDGGAGLGKHHADHPENFIEVGHVLTLEGLETRIDGRGWISLEEDVYVSQEGPVYLTSPQREIMLVPKR